MENYISNRREVCLFRSTRAEEHLSTCIILPIWISLDYQVFSMIIFLSKKTNTLFQNGSPIAGTGNTYRDNSATSADGVISPNYLRTMHDITQSDRKII